MPEPALVANLADPGWSSDVLAAGVVDGALIIRDRVVGPVGGAWCTSRLGLPVATPTATATDAP